MSMEDRSTVIGAQVSDSNARMLEHLGRFHLKVQISKPQALSPHDIYEYQVDRLRRMQFDMGIVFLDPLSEKAVALGKTFIGISQQRGLLRRLDDGTIHGLVDGVIPQMYKIIRFINMPLRNLQVMGPPVTMVYDHVTIGQDQVHRITLEKPLLHIVAQKTESQPDVKIFYFDPSGQKYDELHDEHFYGELPGILLGELFDKFIRINGDLTQNSLLARDKIVLKSGHIRIPDHKPIGGGEVDLVYKDKDANAFAVNYSMMYGLHTRLKNYRALDEE